MTEPTATTERWTYLGRRYYGASGMVHLWEKADGTEAAFKKFPASAPGAIYEVTVVDGDKVRGRPVWTGDTIDVDRRAVLSAADQFAYAEKANVDAEKRLSKSTELDEAMEPLLRLARQCRTSGEMEALQQVVRSRMVKARWKS